MREHDNVLSPLEAKNERGLRRVENRFNRALSNSIAGLDAFYDEVVRGLNQRHHTFPSEIEDFNIGQEAEGRISSLNSMARHAGEGYRYSDDGRYVWKDGGWKSVGKVIF